jgi:tetratricopeptide (TPR) repeat protein
VEAQCERLRKAVARSSDDAFLRNDLAVTLCVLGEHNEAFAEIKKAVELRPKNPAIYVNAAVIAGYLFGAEGTLFWTEAALAIDPTHVGAMLLHARSLARLGMCDEAVTLSGIAVSLEPKNGQAHSFLGLSLAAARRYDEALMAFEHAESLSSDGDIAVYKARALLEMGMQNKAIADLEAVLSREPHLVSAMYTRAFASDFQLDDEHIAAMERALQSTQSLSFEDRVRLEFALGRSYLSKSDLPIAFVHLNLANKLKRSSIRYDVTTDESIVEDLIQRYSATTMSDWGGNACKSDIPIFVIGMPRSGTSLVEQILASHPLVFGAGELGFVASIAQRFGANGFEQLREMGERYVERASALASSATRIVDKMPLNFFHAGLIHLMLPRARIIHCRRDPVDTCLSAYVTLFEEHLEFTYDPDELSRFYRAYARLMAHWRTVLPPEQFLEIEYEKLTTEPENATRRLIDFCRLPWDDRCLLFYATDRPVRTASLTQVRRPMYTSSVGRGQEWLPYVPLDLEAP